MAPRQLFWLRASGKFKHDAANDNEDERHFNQADNFFAGTHIMLFFYDWCWSGSSHPILDGVRFLGEGFHFRCNFIADFTCLLENFFCGAGERRWIRKRPIESFDAAWENGTSFGAGFVANGDDSIVQPTLAEEVENCLGAFLAEVDSHLGHDGNHVGVEGTGVEYGAFDHEMVAAVFFQKGFGHLAAGGVVDADKKDFVLNVGCGWHIIMLLRYDDGFGQKKLSLVILEFATLQVPWARCRVYVQPLGLMQRQTLLPSAVPGMRLRCACYQSCYCNITI